MYGSKTQLNHVAATLALLVSGSVLAHGYISQPESRNYLCKTGGNSQCGAVQWEPQSVEGPSGFRRPVRPMARSPRPAVPAGAS